MSAAGAHAAPRAGRRPLRETARGLWERHPALVGYPLLLALVAVSRASSWRKPLASDTGQYLYVGQVILDGGVPYADAAQNKGPLLYLLFAAINLLDGGSSIMVRAFLALFAALAALALAGYAARAAGRAAGVFAGVYAALLSGALVTQGDDPNSEQFGLAPLAGAWYLATRPGARWAFAAGAAAGAAAAMNVAFLVAWPVIAFELWRGTEAGAALGARLRRLGTAALGALAVIAPLALWLGLSGALDDFRELSLGQAERATGGEALAERADQAGFWDLHQLLNVPAGGLWVAALLGCAIAAWRAPRLRGPAFAAFAWMALVYLRVKTATYESPHHWLVATPGVVVGLTLGLAALWGRSVAERAAAGAIVVLLATWPVTAGPQFAALAVPPWERYGPGSAFAESSPVAAFVDRNTRPGEPILVAQGSAQVYWYADRRAPSRWFDVTASRESAAFTAERRAELLAAPPPAIVVMPGTPPEAEVQELLDTRPYRLAYDVRGAKVYLLD